MAKLVLIDGNSILNRAFYGIMASKMLMTQDGMYTNAIYGFLNIMFKTQEEINPEYLVVAFDNKGTIIRRKMYEDYKATRKPMPQELAEQMPKLKEVLRAMNIKIIEKEGYEGDDIVGTLSRFGEKQGLDVTILSGDKDNFQLATDKVSIQIPRTKAGKSETDIYNKEKIMEEFGILPEQLIEVKGLMGDNSDNIPGVPGIGEKTALALIKEYENLDKLYEKLEKGETDIKDKTKEKLMANKELAFLSRDLGRINVESPIEENLEDMKIQEWDKEKVLDLFKKYRFVRFIDRFKLQGASDTKEVKDEKIYEKKVPTKEEIEEILNKVKERKELIYSFGTEEENEPKNIINKKITNISIVNNEEKLVYFIELKDIQLEEVKEIFEDNTIKKYGFELARDYILLRQIGIEMENLYFDAKIAAYLLSPTASKYTIENLSLEYLELDIEEYLSNKGVQETQQINLFNVEQQTTISANEAEQYKNIIKAYSISKLYDVLIKKLKEQNSLDLFNNIEMPMVKVLADMQYVGMYVDKEELTNYGNVLKEQIEELKKQIFELAGEEFNINSPKQLGELLFEKLKLKAMKKNKNGYSTDVEVLEKLKGEHPIIEKLLEYRGIVKLNSTYVEGMLPFVNQVDSRIHSYFHQTVTATGRISSTEPNLQNIPTRVEAGKKIRKAFKAGPDKVFIDADYSQIELRVLAHIANDETMLQAFNNDEDIHKQAAAKVFNIPQEEVTHEERAKAKAVNFGIVYGISDFGLAEQIGVPKKQAKEYIEQYLEKYSGIKQFMTNIVEEAKEKGYVETLFNRRRYIPELTSNSYMIRQFGARAAMNTPIQGTAADIMKIAMLNTYNELKKNNLKSKIVLQVHDELIIEALVSEKDEVAKILKNCMENAIKMNVPLKVELQEANNWYDAK